MWQASRQNSQHRKLTCQGQRNSTFGGAKVKKTCLPGRPSSAIGSDAAPSWPIKVIFQLSLRCSASPLQLTPSAFKPGANDKFSFITILYSPDSPLLQRCSSPPLLFLQALVWHTFLQLCPEGIRLIGCNACPSPHVCTVGSYVFCLPVKSDMEMPLKDFISSLLVSTSVFFSRATYIVPCVKKDNWNDF